MKKQTSFFASVLACLLLAGGAGAAPEFLYFQPGKLTSPDGKFTLAAFKSGEEKELFYVTAKGDRLEIISDLVFPGLEVPDLRGYGPTSAVFSQRGREEGEDEDAYFYIVGELVITSSEGRRMSDVAIHSQKMVEGKMRLVDAKLDLGEFADLGRKDLDKKLEAAGLLPGPDEFLHGIGGSTAVVTKDGEEYVGMEQGTFPLEDGILLRVSEVFSTQDKDGKDLMPAFSVLLHVTRDDKGDVAAKLLEIESSLDH